MNKTKLYIIRYSIVLLIFAFGLSISYAWVHNQRQIETTTVVDKPTALSINGGNNDPIAYIDVGKIDVTQDAGEHHVIFSVDGNMSVDKYDLQLSYTTNIPFKYEIYQANLIASDSINKKVCYTSVLDNKEYCYGFATLIGNSDSGFTQALNNVSNIAYETYANVHNMTNPRYIYMDNISSNGELNYFPHYYILTISWNENQNIDYKKETDIIYLIAEQSV